ncbi:hypothetical protein FK513_29495, partial [Klebsiella pneumoniae]|nr:hypothetical protein [Klebsiella pneumoniae]
ETVGRLAEIKNIVGIKEATGMLLSAFSFLGLALTDFSTQQWATTRCSTSGVIKNRPWVRAIR